MEKIIEKRTILGVLLFVLYAGCLIEYNVCPSDTLHDYKYVAYYLDGGQATRELDSVSSYRNELNRAGWKFQCFYYHNGEYESDIDFVTRYKIYNLRSYPNNTAHRRWHLFLSSFLYTAFAVIAAAFLFTFTKWYERYCKKQLNEELWQK
jgi:hypothetical protein